MQEVQQLRKEVEELSIEKTLLALQETERQDLVKLKHEEEVEFFSNFSEVLF